MSDTDPFAEELDAMSNPSDFEEFFDEKPLELEPGQYHFLVEDLKKTVNKDPQKGPTRVLTCVCIGDVNNPEDKDCIGLKQKIYISDKQAPYRVPSLCAAMDCPTEINPTTGKPRYKFSPSEVVGKVFLGTVENVKNFNDPTKTFKNITKEESDTEAAEELAIAYKMRAK